MERPTEAYKEASFGVNVVLNGYIPKLGLRARHSAAAKLMDVIIRAFALSVFAFTSIN